MTASRVSSGTVLACLIAPSGDALLGPTESQKGLAADDGMIGKENTYPLVPTCDDPRVDRIISEELLTKKIYYVIFITVL